MTQAKRFSSDSEYREPRFTVEQLDELARVIKRDYSNMGNIYWALRQSSETEAKVMGLVEALEAMILDWEFEVRPRENDYCAGWVHASQSHAGALREALSKFRGE